MFKDSVSYKLLGSDRVEEDSSTIKRRASSVYSEYTDPALSGEPVLLNEASSVSCMINLTNTIIGAGVLALPYAVANSGSILGIVLIVISGSMQIFSLHILSVCAAKVPPPSSFYSVTQASTPSLTVLIDLAVAIQSFGVCSSYFIVMGGLMPEVMNAFDIDGIWSSRLAWILIGFSIVSPLSALHKLDALKYTSGLSVLFVLFLTLLVLGFSIHGDGLHPCPSEDDGGCVGDKPYASVTNSTFRVFSIFTNAFSCQSNIFGVVNEIRNPTQRRVDMVSTSSILAAGIIYGTVAMAGFYTFGDAVESNILLNYPNTHLTSVGRVCVSLLVAFSYPILLQPGRNSILGLWRFCDVDEESWIKYNSFRYALVTVVFLGGSLLTALSVSDLGIVFSLVGATGATMVSFILPGAAYYAMHQHEGEAWKRAGALALSISGCVIMPVCLVFIFI